jgi:hypothetical protein
MLDRANMDGSASEQELYVGLKRGFPSFTLSEAGVKSLKSANLAGAGGI